MKGALNHAALHIAGDAAADTLDIDFEGSIDGSANDPGRGVQIEKCTQCSVKLSENGATDYGFVVGLNADPGGIATPCGSSSIGAPGVIYDGEGSEATTTLCIDPAAAGLIQYPVRQTLLTAASTTTPVAAIGNLVVSSTATSGTTITVSGASAVLPMNPKYPLAELLRSGPTLSGFTDTWDSAANIIGALSPSNGSGFLYHARICNEANPAETLSAGMGDTLAGTMVVNGGSCVPFTVTVTGASTVTISGG